ncbi:MAG: EAL domain-containing protein [Desulforhopalus sp.]|nr:EAL domain-containing protein [Desulforhopalus sp.]
MTDTITGLPDRHQFMDILRGQIYEANEHKIKLAVFVIKIDRFRKINNLYGYAAGDQVLRSFAEILNKVRRQGDYIARVGDNEFTLLLTGIANEGHATLAAFKIQRLLEIPIEFDGGKLTFGVHIGITLYPAHSSESGDMLKKAEEALEESKRTEQLFCIADVSEDLYISKNWEIETQLAKAIDNSELCVYFQPKISLSTGKPVGAEALIRWNSPSRGLLSPDVFLPVAEELGLMKQLTIWMLNSALRLSNEWTKQWGALDVSVNISTKLLEKPDFVDIVLSSNGLWGNDNITLSLEVLEQYFVVDVENCFAKLKELRNEGINISIDDFGTGYSSLSYFRDIPADELKIDRSFVSGLLGDEANAKIVALITDLAHKFGLSVVAEGAENLETLEALKKLNCDKVQGYIIAKPIPAEQFGNWLRQFHQLR